MRRRRRQLSGRRTYDVPVTLTLPELGETVEAIVAVDYVHEHDPSYGADADGNRGMPVDEYYIDDWKLLSVTRFDGGRRALLAHLGFAPELRTRMTQQIETALETWQPDYDPAEFDEEPPDKEGR